MPKEIKFDYFEDTNTPTDLTPEAFTYIANTKHSPSRMVGVNAYNNLCSFVPSKKMGVTISVESHSAETAFALLCENDPNISKYYDQPEPIPIKKTIKNGQQRPFSYTPDFLIKYLDRYFVVEVKPEERLRELVEEQPKNWVQLDSGHFEYIPAKTAFATIGLSHIVWSYKKDFAYYIKNLSVLMISRERNFSNANITSLAGKLFDEAYYWTLSDLFEGLGLDSYTDLIKLVDDGYLHADLKGSLLSIPTGCVVVRNENLLDSAKQSFKQRGLFPNLSSSISALSIPSEATSIKVLKRLERISSGEKSRSIRRWKSIISANPSVTPFEALIDKAFNQGNRKPRLNKSVVDYLNYYLKSEHGTLSGISKYRSFIRYSVQSEKHHPKYPSVSLNTFIKYLRKIPESVIAFQRGGIRLRNGLLPPTASQDRNLQPVLPWESAAIDEYLADIYLVFYTMDGKPYVARPWITAMIDLATSKILAMTLSFKNPSKRSLAKVIRECVRKHGKLPREIIFDRGSNFKSRYAAELLAYLGVINTMRPAGYPQIGGQVEELFGEFVKQWLSQLPGNTADFKEARSVDGKLTPRNKAVLQPIDFYRALNLFIEWRDAKPSGFLNSSRVDQFRRGSTQYPFMGITANYDERFLLATAVDTKKYTVNPQRGIHIGQQHHWAPQLSQIIGRNTKAEVRIDPENPHVVFALIDKSWIPCYSSRINQFNVLGPEHQLMEGLISLETQPLKKALTIQADKNAVEIIDSLKNSSEEFTKVAEVSFESSQDDQLIEGNLAQLFEDLKSVKVRTIKSEAWDQ